jgi:hypothetical protein
MTRTSCVEKGFGVPRTAEGADSERRYPMYLSECYQRCCQGDEAPTAELSR